MSAVPSPWARAALAHVARLDDSVEAHAERLGIPVEWHEGRRLGVETLEQHPTFRGAAIVEVGRSIAEHGCLDTEVVGRAVRDGRHDVQDLKRVGHHVARWGLPWHS